jgi:predicted DNA-binding transcriptional regulator YafY
VVRPYGLHHREGVWYLAAFCTHREADRVFRLSRIRDARLTDRIFDQPEEFDVAGFVERSLTVPTSGRRQVVIRFSPGVARWIQERWGPEYLSMETDGSVVARLHDVSEEFVLAYVASFGGEAVIQEPEELAQRLRQEASEALSTYE